MDKEVADYWKTKESTEHFRWLKSIRIFSKNGYMRDEDCHRIQEYFLKVNFSTKAGKNG